MYTWYQQGQALLEEIRQTHLPKNMLALWFTGQNSFVVKYEDRCLYIDPVLCPITGADGSPRTHYAPPFAPEDADMVDTVLCTHGHLDHAHPETLRRMPAGCIVLPEPAMEEIAAQGVKQERLLPACVGKSIALGKVIHVTPVPAAHPEDGPDENGSYPCLGYVLQMGPLTLYNAGDTYATTHIRQALAALPKPDVAILPINGEDLERRERGLIGNMNEQDAAKFSRDIGANLVIPAHYDMMKGNGGKPWLFAGYMLEAAPGRKFHICALGERFVYAKGTAG